MTDPTDTPAASRTPRTPSVLLVLGVGAAVGMSIAALTVALNDDDPVCIQPAHAEEDITIL
jgi:hypothetical protein